MLHQWWFVSLQGLHQLDSTNSSSVTIPDPLMSKESHFVEELKITSKWANMINEGEDSNTENDDEPIQTTRKLTLNPLKQKLLKIKSLVWNVR